MAAQYHLRRSQRMGGQAGSGRQLGRANVHVMLRAEQRGALLLCTPLLGQLLFLKYLADD
jgi:hypothetical protein